MSGGYRNYIRASEASQALRSTYFFFIVRTTPVRRTSSRSSPEPQFKRLADLRLGKQREQKGLDHEIQQRARHCDAGDLHARAALPSRARRSIQIRASTVTDDVRRPRTWRQPRTQRLALRRHDAMPEIDHRGTGHAAHAQDDLRLADARITCRDPHARTGESTSASTGNVITDPGSAWPLKREVRPHPHAPERRDRPRLPRRAETSNRTRTGTHRAARNKIALRGARSGLHGISPLPFVPIFRVPVFPGMRRYFLAPMLRYSRAADEWSAHPAHPDSVRGTRAEAARRPRNRASAPESTRSTRGRTRVAMRLIAIRGFARASSRPGPDFRAPDLATPLQIISVGIIDGVEPQDRARVVGNLLPFGFAQSDPRPPLIGRNIFCVRRHGLPVILAGLLETGCSAPAGGPAHTRPRRSADKAQRPFRNPSALRFRSFSWLLRDLSRRPFSRPWARAPKWR